MLIRIPNVLTGEQVAQCRQALAAAEWADGRRTAGHQSIAVKHNMQLPESDPAARRLGDTILGALEGNALFLTAALPLKVYPPRFNRYESGQSFGNHIDSAIMPLAGTPHRIRSDLSATLFLSEPEDYEGGELVIEDSFGAHRVKLPAGDMILYPAGSLHNVQPVTAGTRVASFLWIQSMVRDDGERALLFDLDIAIQQARDAIPNDQAVVHLTNIYHNLLRRWADA